MVRIDLRELEIGQHEINIECTSEEVGLGPDEMTDIRVDIRLDYDGQEALVVVEASAVANLVCDRTVVPFKLPVKGSYTVLFSPNEGDQESESEVRPLAASDEEIDITQIVRDTLLLAIPIRKIAPGSEKEEILTTFGVSEELKGIDPRWHVLAELKEEAGGDGLPENE